MTREEFEKIIDNNSIDSSRMYDGNIILNAIYSLFKKEWYENPDNFPCLCVDTYDNPIIIFSQEEYKKCPRLRLATKEEVLSLFVDS